MPRVLFIGDVVAEPGRDALAKELPKLREQYSPDFVVVNGENVAGGVGITERTAKAIFDAGADVITLGNHSFRHREVYPYLNTERRIVRPANYHHSAPGRGATVVENNQLQLAVVNLSGNLSMSQANSPFDEVDKQLAALDDADLILVDMHAEATSEKMAMGYHLDGRVTAVVGTHTHVPTADAKVLPGGTAYITDVGMTGSQAGVIGVRKEPILTRMRTGMPTRFDSATGDEHVMGVLIEATRDGRATGIEQLILPVTL